MPRFLLPCTNERTATVPTRNGATITSLPEAAKMVATTTIPKGSLSLLRKAFILASLRYGHGAIGTVAADPVLMQWIHFDNLADLKDLLGELSVVVMVGLAVRVAIVVSPTDRTDINPVLDDKQRVILKARGEHHNGPYPSAIVLPAASRSIGHDRAAEPRHVLGVLPDCFGADSRISDIGGLSRSSGMVNRLLDGCGGYGFCRNRIRTVEKHLL